MGIFDVFKKKEVETTATAPSINLRKETVTKICLEKKELTNLTARVILAIDYSGSMSSLYNNGTVQSTLERILPLALRFDDDGEMGVWRFDDKFKKLKDMNLSNLNHYTAKEIMKGSMGGTNYAGVMKDICTNYITREPLDVPTYVIFITDGDCWDKVETERVVREASHNNIFWQFVGIGNSNFNFLEKLDDMGGRYLDNADFFAIKDLNRISDEELYRKLLNEFPSWIKQARSKGLIK